MHNQDTYEWIERYLNGECDAEEAAQLEAKASAEPEFAALLKLHTEIQSTVADADAMAFSNALAAADQAYHSEIQASNLESNASEIDQIEKPRTSYFRIWGIAASIAILIGIGGYFMYVNRAQSPEALFSEYFDPAFAPSNFRSDADVLDSLYRKAFDAYNANDFSNAIPAFETIYNNDTKQSTAEFYLGMSFLANNNPEAAIPFFERLAKSANTFQQQSQWYIALCFLKRGQPDKAEAYLNELSNTSGKYQSKAQELLKKMK